MNALLRVACLATVLLCRLTAAPVAVGDFSFEVNTGVAGNELTAGGYHYNLDPEWKETAGPNNGAGFEEFITGFVADGTDHLGMEINHDVWQDLAVTYQPNTRYTLTVATGNRSGSTQSGNHSQYLLADSTGAIFATGIFNASAIPAGTFADAPALVFDTPNSTASVGKTIRILLQSRGGGRSHFDKIRLDQVSLIPPRRRGFGKPARHRDHRHHRHPQRPGHRHRQQRALHHPLLGHRQRRHQRRRLGLLDSPWQLHRQLVR